jgi:hypothetical protein
MKGIYFVILQYFLQPSVMYPFFSCQFRRIQHSNTDTIVTIKELYHSVHQDLN